MVRHSGATVATVTLRVAKDGLRVEVGDNGIGIDPSATAGVGLVSLRERAVELGGRSEVTARPGGGTVVVAVLPLVSGDAVSTVTTSVPEAGGVRR